MARPIGTLGVIPTLTIAGRVFTDLTTLIITGGVVVTPGNRTSLRLPNGSAGYPVTALKTLNIVAIEVQNSSAAGNADAVTQFGYGDNDVGVDSATAITNPVYYGGSATNSIMAPAAAQSTQQFILNFNVPAGKYVFFQNNASANVSIRIFGYET